MTTQQRIQELRRKVSDAVTAVDILYSPYEVCLRASLNTGARRAAEVGVVNAVSGMEVARRVLAAAEASHQTSQHQTNGDTSKVSFKLAKVACERCGKTGMVCFNPKTFKKMCFCCGAGQ